MIAVDASVGVRWFVDGPGSERAPLVTADGKLAGLAERAGVTCEVIA